MKVVKKTQLVLGLFVLISSSFAFEAILKGGGTQDNQANMELLANPEAKADYIKTKKVTATRIENEVIQNSTRNYQVPVEGADELVPHKGMLNWDSRFPSTIAYDEGSTGYGGFIFNEGDSMAVWYRPLTDCTVEGVEVQFYDTSELIGTDVTIVVREVLDVTSTGVEANGVYDFSMYNETTGDFMGDILATYTMPLTSSDVGVMLDIAFDTPVDVGANDFAIQVIGNMGGDEPDFIYWAGVNGAGIQYNHGFKYYYTGASYCSEGCWVPRLNFGMNAKVDYYGDPPPFISDVEDLPDVYESCDGGPYEPTVHFEDVGTAEFTGALTSVLFMYHTGMDTDTTELVGSDVDGVFTGYIPSQPVGTTVTYWWAATDNGDQNPSGGVTHTTDLERSPLTFTIKEQTDGADVLVLDDGPNPVDATYAGRIADALYGLGYSTDLWNTKSSGLLSECGMDYYDYIVLVQGLNGSGNMGVGSDLEAYMMSRLDAGGNLLMTSVDYIYAITEGAEDWNSVDAAAYDFLANYLHVSDYWSDTNYDVFGESTDTLYRGIEDNILTGDIAEFQMHSPENSNWSDQVIPDDDAESIFEVYSDAEEDWVDFGGVMHNGDFKSVFVPWHLEGVDDDEVLNTFLDNTMMWFGVEHAPVISSLSGPAGPTFSTEEQVISASVADADGDAFSVNLNYSVDGGEYMAVEMTDNGDGTFSGTLPGQSGGVSVDYFVEAGDAGGFTETDVINYFIYQPSSNVLLVLNNEMSQGGYAYPADYYLLDYVGYQETGSINYFGNPDYWPYSRYGSVTAELLAFYNTVIEITTTSDYPLYGGYGAHTDLMLNWLNEGGKNYVLAGDETFGIANMSWGDVAYEPGTFFYEMGVMSTLNDMGVGGASPLFASDMYGLSGAINNHLGEGDTLMYDPEYEIDFTNWMDGAEPTTGTDVALRDENGNAIVLYKEWDNGNKTVYMGIDPISLNSSPNYYWYGASVNGILPQALDWFGDIELSIDNNIFELPREFKLYQNHPNPFNPTTNINFDIAEATDVKLTIYNLLGKEIITLVDDNMVAGSYHHVWNGKNNIGIDVPSGVYFYRLSTNQFTQTNKMILMK